jgi:hypothetical protein
MKKFLAVYIGNNAAPKRAQWDALEPEKRKAREAEGMRAWMAWVAEHQASIVDGGAPLGKTKRVAPEGISDIKNAMAAYVVVRAESYDAAAKLFENHPHFTIFPGDSVEIMECLPIPSR